MEKLSLLLGVLTVGPFMFLDLIAEMVIPEPVAILYFGIF